MRSIALGIIALAGSAVVIMPSPATAAACPVTPAPAAEAGITGMINATRASKDLATLETHQALRAAARRWSTRMAATGEFEHSSMGWAGGRAAGENIAMAWTAGGAFRVQMESPPHRRNLLTRAWRFTGVGVAERCDGALFVTVDLMASSGGLTPA